jgi:hypothetical protein
MPPRKHIKHSDPAATAEHIVVATAEQRLLKISPAAGKDAFDQLGKHNNQEARPGSGQGHTMVQVPDSSVARVKDLYEEGSPAAAEMPPR